MMFRYHNLPVSSVRPYASRCLASPTELYSKFEVGKTKALEMKARPNHCSKIRLLNGDWIFRP